MPKFTPEPWYISPPIEESTKYGVPRYIRAGTYEKSRCVAQMCGDDPRGPETWEANARIVASAPEMYEALKRLVTPESLSLDEEDQDFALRVIAKAEGRDE